VRLGQAAIVGKGIQQRIERRCQRAGQIAVDAIDVGMISALGFFSDIVSS
jgi:hypothetical protein